MTRRDRYKKEHQTINTRPKVEVRTTTAPKLSARALASRTIGAAAGKGRNGDESALARGSTPCETNARHSSSMASAKSTSIRHLSPAGTRWAKRDYALVRRHTGVLVLARSFSSSSSSLSL